MKIFKNTVSVILFSTFLPQGMVISLGSIGKSNSSTLENLEMEMIVKVQMKVDKIQGQTREVLKRNRERSLKNPRKMRQK